VRPIACAPAGTSVVATLHVVAPLGERAAVRRPRGVERGQVGVALEVVGEHDAGERDAGQLVEETDRRRPNVTGAFHQVRTRSINGGWLCEVWIVGPWYAADDDFICAVRSVADRDAKADIDRHQRMQSIGAPSRLMSRKLIVYR
jgi:hypothetical protein